MGIGKENYLMELPMLKTGEQTINFIKKTGQYESFTCPELIFVISNNFFNASGKLSSHFRYDVKTLL